MNFLSDGACEFLTEPKSTLPPSVLSFDLRSYYQTNLTNNIFNILVLVLF